MKSRRMKWKMLPSFSWKTKWMKMKFSSNTTSPSFAVVKKVPEWIHSCIPFWFQWCHWCFSYMSVCTWRRRIALLIMVRVLIAYLVSPVPSLRAGVPPAVLEVFYMKFLNKFEPPRSYKSPSSQIHPPRSLTFHAPVSNEVGWYEPASARPQTDRPMDLEGIGAMPNERSFKSNPGSNLTRVQLAAKSPVVLTVWGQCVKLLLPVSNALQQMDMSLNCEEHHHRFLNQFAATTLVKYLSALLRFVHMCEEMRVELHDLSDVSMADILITGSMARRSDGSGPRHSVTIKALRWACKQLEIRCFESAFSSLVASFEKQKIPYDRKEALPLPLFTLIQWERRILSSASSLQEVVILGGLLLLAWSGLRFSDLQRSYLDSWRLDSTSLRGLCWRSKTCNQSTPFGIKLAGFLSVGAFTWVHRYLMVLDQMYALELSRSIDFAIPSFGGGAEPMYPFTAMPFGEALYFLRTLLQLPWRTKTCEPIPSGMSYSIPFMAWRLRCWVGRLRLKWTRQIVVCMANIKRNPNQFNFIVVTTFLAVWDCSRHWSRRSNQVGVPRLRWHGEDKHLFQKSSLLLKSFPKLSPQWYGSSSALTFVLTRL